MLENDFFVKEHSSEQNYWNDTSDISLFKKIVQTDGTRSNQS